MIEITIAGDPVSKGSMKAFTYQDKGGKYRSAITHSNAKTKTWQKQVEREIKHTLKLLGRWQMLDCAVRVRMQFWLTKPKSVKRSHPCVKPDIDKLARTVADALEGTLLTNDSRIVELHVLKAYALAEPGCRIEVEEL